jgi:hypothetical protein
MQISFHFAFIILFFGIFCGAHTFDYLDSIISSRIELLKKVALRHKRPQNCKTINGIGIAGTYGRFGNRLVQYAHALWIAEELKRPVFIGRSDLVFLVFRDIDTTLLESIFCIQSDKRHNYTRLRAINFHNPERLYSKYKKELPPFSDPGIRLRLYDVVTTFYSAYFASIKTPVVHHAVSFIKHSLHSLNYIGIHKRSYEGRCRTCEFSSFDISNYSSHDFDLSTPAWRALNRYSEITDGSRRMPFHPLCDMTPEVVQGALRAHSMDHKNSKYFLATDEQEPYEDLLGIGAVLFHVPDVSHNSDASKVNHTKHSYAQSTSDNSNRSAADQSQYLQFDPNVATSNPTQSVDLVILLHSALMIRHYGSSYSLGVSIARDVLQLPNSPATIPMTLTTFYGNNFDDLNIMSVHINYTSSLSDDAAWERSGNITAN